MTFATEVRRLFTGNLAELRLEASQIDPV